MRRSQSKFRTDLSRTDLTRLNCSTIDNDVHTELRHKDMFTIGDRHFRWEFPEGSPHHLKNNADLGSAEETKSDVDDGKILSPINKAPTLPMEIPIFSLNFSAFYGHRSVAEPGPTPSPWNIVSVST